MRTKPEAVPAVADPSAARERAPAASPAAPGPHASVLRLQRAAGNAAVQRALVQRSAAGAASGITPEVEDAIHAARGGGQALDGGVRAQMEGAMGADFSGVRVHTDSRADALGQALGARAFTTGRDVFFRQGEYSPGSAGGRRLVAHELTHVVQQSGAPVQRSLTLGPADDAFEREADGVASAVADGLEAGVEQGDGGGTVRRAPAAAAPPAGQEQEESEWERLLTPENAALLALSLATGIPAPLLEALTPKVLRAILERLPLEQVARTVGMLPLPAIAPLIGPVAIHLDPLRTREVLRGLGEDNLREMAASPETRSSLLDAVKKLVSQLWPVGMGVALDAGIGLTFGIPIYAGMDYLMYLWHASDDSFKFTRRVEGRLAFNPGVGAGAYLGKQRKGGNASAAGGPTQAEYGVGAAAGAEFEGGGKAILLQDFEFPVYEDAAFLSLVLAVTTGDTGSVGGVAVRLLEGMAGMKVDPMRYNTRTRVDAALYAQAVAEASAGLRLGTPASPGTAPAGAGGAPQAAPGQPPPKPPKQESEWTARGSGWKGWKEGAPDMGSRPPTLDWTDLVSKRNVWNTLLNQLNASLGGRLFAQAGLAVEVRPRRPGGIVTDPVPGVADAEELEVDVMAEGSVAGSLVADVPLLRTALPSLGPEFGGGIKLSYVLSRKAGAPGVRMQRYSFFHKKGELDVYSGVAEETELRVRAGAAEGLFPDMPASFDEVFGRVEELRIRRRVRMGGALGESLNALLLGRDLGGTLKRQQQARALLKDQYNQRGYTAEGFVTFTLVLTRDDIVAVARAIDQAKNQVFSTGNAWSKVLGDLWLFLTTGDAPDYVKRVVGVIATRTHVAEFVFHTRAGIVGAAGARVGTGPLNARVHGRGGALGFYESENVFEKVALSPAMIVQILLSAIV